MTEIEIRVRDTQVHNQVIDGVRKYWNLFSDTDKNAIKSAILRAERKIAAQKIKNMGKDQS